MEELIKEYIDLKIEDAFNYMNYLKRLKIPLNNQKGIMQT